MYGDAAVAALEAHDPSGAPLFMYLPWQAVHTPYTAPPGWNASSQSCDHYEDACIVYGMLSVADDYVGKITDLLHAKGMWSSTLILFSADNGGVTYGVNYPLRGEKHTSWEGGMRVAAFVSGGFVPSALRGTTSDLIVHITDWYPTLCGLAGADPTDDPPIPPLPVDPEDPGRDIYRGNESFPPVDGVDVWSLLTSSAKPNATAAHPTLWLSHEVMLVGDYKIIVAQPSPKIMAAKTINNGWKYPNGTWIPSDDKVYGCNAYQERTHFRPCLFDVIADPREETNLASLQPDRLDAMWALLNRTLLTAYHARSPASLLGPCKKKCANKHWANLGLVEITAEEAGVGFVAEAFGEVGPICGVPGCGSELAELDAQRL